MARQTVFIAALIVFGFSLVAWLPCQADDGVTYGCYHFRNGKLRIVSNHSECRPPELPILLYGTTPVQPWVCPDDDEANGIYWICNYLPLNPNNRWRYTTGDRFVLDNTQICTSGYSGILYGSNTYEYSPYMENGEDGLLFSGCQYDGGWLKDSGHHWILIPPQMHVGETASQYMPPGAFGEYGVYLDTTLVGLETITVPAGTFSTLKVEHMIQHDDGSCSYKTTVWYAKGVGPVKIHRTEANPSDCLGCIYVCDPDDDVIKLNTAAELISATINGVTY